MSAFLATLAAFFFAAMAFPGLRIVPLMRQPAMEMSGAFLAAFDAGLTAPFNKRLMAIVALGWALATAADPLLWKLLAPGAEYSVGIWAYSLVGNTAVLLVCGEGGLILSSLLGRRYQRHP